MAVLEFSFEDREQGWRLEPVRFGELNLLVGRSGAGKTRILRALARLASTAYGATFPGFDTRWSLTLETSDGVRTWKGETRPRPDQDVVSSTLSSQPQQAPDVLRETLSVDDKVLLTRDESSIQIGAEPSLPAGLEPSSSVLRLLSSNPVVKPVVDALRSVKWSQIETSELWATVRRDRLAHLREAPPSRESIRGLNPLPLALGALLLQWSSPDQFRQIVTAFTEIFPEVADLRVDLREGLSSTEPPSKYPDQAFLDFAIKHHGAGPWILSNAMSSGMRRTLRHILELALYPSGTTLLVDEYENGLGVNCLGPLTDYLLREHRGIQFILTSHHPYVIHNIPWEYWKIVTSHGSVVRVRDHTDFPELVTRSKHDRFQLLLSALAADEESAG